MDIMFTPKDLIAFLALLLVALILSIVQRRLSRLNRSTLPIAPPANANLKSGIESDVNKDRRPGDWTPVRFVYPQVTPIAEAIDQIAPRSYRPYKPGRYHTTMGVRPMDWQSWIELDRDFPAYYRLRAERLASPRGPKLYCTLPDRPNLVRGGADAARELVHELAEFLVARYPDVYRAKRRRGVIVAVEVLPVGVTHDLEAEDPVVVAGMLTQDDLAIMIEGTDGQYYLQAGAILLPGFWRLEDKAGLPLDAIHTSGHVPHYEEKLQPSLTRFFRRLSPNSPVERKNWFIQVLPPTSAPTPSRLEELAWAEGTYGPEDMLGKAPGPAPPEPLPDRMRLRVERQSLRRLPRSGAIVFTIRVYMMPLMELGPGEAGRLAAAIRGVREQEAAYRYRKQSNFEDAALEWLDEQHRDEVQRGLAQE